MRRLFPEFRVLPESPSSPYPDLAFPTLMEERPFIYINMAMTLDGRVVVGNPKPGSVLSGSAGDRRGMAELRAAADVVLMGAGTLRAENPTVEIKDIDLRERRREAGRSERPVHGVVTRSGHLDATLRIFSQPGAMIVTTEDGARRVPEAVRVKAEVLIAGQEEVDLPDALRQLRRDYNVRNLLVEGGPTLSYAFISAGLADEFFITLAPLLKAGEEIPTLLEGKAFPFGSLPRFTLHSLAEDASELYLRYVRTSEPQAE